jgi:nucleotide-binding universal stress UspA family protein
MELRKILAPIDATKNSGNGLMYAINLARFSNLELDICHVLQKGMKVQTPHEDILNKDYGENKFIEIIREGEVAPEILKLSLELEPELIIMSPDVFNKGKKFFDESETGRVMKESHYPILIIPPFVEFNHINHIAFVSDLNGNIIASIRELIKIFGNLNPQIEIATIPDRVTEWHFQGDVKSLIQNIKNYTNYENIYAHISEHTDQVRELEVFSTQKTDLICMEYNVNIFYKIFFDSKHDHIDTIKNKPILIFPRRWEDSKKTA